MKNKLNGLKKKDYCVMKLKSKYGPRFPQFIEVIQIFISQWIASWHLKKWNSGYGESAWRLLESSSFHLVQVAPFATQVPLLIILFSFNIKKKNYILNLNHLEDQVWWDQDVIGEGLIS